MSEETSPPGTSATHGAPPLVEPPLAANKMWMQAVDGQLVMQFAFQVGDHVVQATPVALTNKLFKEMEQFFVDFRSRRNP